VERRRAGRDATRGARDLETARRARALANAKTTACVGRARVALLRPTPETDKWETRQLAAQKRVSIGTLPSLDGKKAKGSASAVR
jgi:hypothetical protein